MSGRGKEYTGYQPHPAESANGKPMGRPPLPARGAELQSQLNGYEEEIYALPTEHAHVFNAAGDLLMSKSGTNDRVSFSPAEQRLLVGATFTHNHPEQNSFSEGDIALASRYRMAEIRAVTDNNRFSMRPPAGHRTFSSQMWQNEIQPRVTWHQVQVGKELRAAQKAGTMTDDQAHDQYWHQIWTRVAADTGLRYTIDPWPGQ